MYAYIHPICQQPAFLMADKPEPRRRFLSAPLYDLTSNPLPPGSGDTCQSCGESMFGHAGDIGNVVNYIQRRHENLLKNENEQ